jgi:hypothetical protein
MLEIQYYGINNNDFAPDNKFVLVLYDHTSHFTCVILYISQATPALRSARASDT